MQATLGVPETMLKPVSAFVAAEALPFQIVTDAGCTVQVVPAEEGRQSSVSALQAGGWIACSTAFEMAGRLGVQTRDLGKLLNHLDIKVRACQLGCF